MGFCRRVRLKSLLKLGLLVLVMSALSVLGLNLNGHAKFTNSHDPRSHSENKLGKELRSISAIQMQPLHLKVNTSHFQTVNTSQSPESDTAKEKAVLPPGESKTSRLSTTNISRRFPRIIIVGFGKTGTRALFDTLKMHPDVSGPTKEQRFFSDHYDKGLLSYLHSLPNPPPGGVVVEKSPDYILDDPVASRILESTQNLGVSASKLRFVVMLRDPVDRAMSEYLEWSINRLRAGGKRLPPFHEMAVHKSNGTINDKQPFIRASNYAKYIERWFRFFGKNQTCFVDGDMFVQDPYMVIHELEGCLGLREHFKSGHFVYESKRGFYCFKSFVNQAKSHCMNSTKGRKHPDIPPKVLARLKEYYRPLDARLLPLTGRLMQWQSG